MRSVARRAVVKSSIPTFASQTARRHRDPPGPGAALPRSWPREDRAPQPKPRCGRVGNERCRCCRPSRRRLPGRRCPFLYLNLLDVGVANGDVVLLVLKDNEPGLPVPVHGPRLVGTVRSRYTHDFAFKWGQDVLGPLSLCVSADCLRELPPALLFFQGASRSLPGLKRGSISLVKLDDPFGRSDSCGPQPFCPADWMHPIALFPGEGESGFRGDLVDVSINRS